LDSSKEKIRQWTFNEHGYVEHIRQSIALNGSELAQVMQKARGDIVTDIRATGAGYPDNEILLIDNIKSKMVVPLMAHQTPSGSLSIGSRQADAYNPQALKLLEQLTPQLAIAIDKALLIDAMEQRAGEMQLLNRLGEMLLSTTDLNFIVDTALNMLPRLLPGNTQGLIVVGDEGAYVGAAIPYGFKHGQQILDDILGRFFEISEGATPLEIISSKCVAGNMPVESDWKAITTLSLPILTRQGIQGLVYLASGKEETFNEDVLRIASLIVSQISATIANAQLFHQVEQERARLAAILNSITDAVLVVNRTGRIVLDNPAARNVMAVEESKSGHLLAESTTLRPLIELFEDAMQGGNPTGELELEDGRTFFANLSPVSIGGQDVTGWVATMQDVSHFKELNELKNDFVSSVSHDLRTPLSTILLAINLVAEAGLVNQDQQGLLNSVDRQVRAMSDLIEDILDVGKIEAGIDMEMEPCDVGPIIDTVATTLLPQAADKTIQLEQCVEENLPPVLANATRLHQVIYNLVGNAIKYTPNKGSVTVKAYPQDGEMRIQVIDTGLGIPPADQPRIFEKFYRVQGEHMADIKGSGLGLAITKGIVEKHHGRIWLESVFGKGSTFTVAMPIYTGDAV
jgi:PAS domain S-box-containing protein